MNDNVKVYNPDNIKVTLNGVEMSEGYSGPTPSMKIPQRELLYNAIRCPDGTVIQSRHRHDYVEHTQADGSIYLVDGGLGYNSRYGGTNIELIELLQVYTDDPHEKIREVFEWGSYLDKEGNPLGVTIYRKLKDLEDGHVVALVKWTSDSYPTKINKVFVDEMRWRGLNEFSED